MKLENDMTNKNDYQNDTPIQLKYFRIAKILQFYRWNNIYVKNLKNPNMSLGIERISGLL